MEHVLDLNADLVFLTETWLTSQRNDVTSTVSSYGYKLHHQIRCDERKSRGGGVGIAVHSSHRLVKVKSSKYDSFEHCAYSLKKDKQIKTIFVSFYRLLNVPISCFMNEFTTLLESLCCMNCNLLLAGDVNIHLDNIQSPESISFTNLLASFDLTQFVSTPTHNKGHILDVVIGNSISSCSNISVTDVNLSDHFLINGLFKCEFRSTTYYKTIHYRKLKSVDPIKLAEDLDVQLQSFRDSRNQQFGEQVSLYNRTLTEVIDNHAPLLHKTIKVVPDAPWFDFEYHELRKKRRKAEKLYGKTKLHVHKSNFIDLRKQTTLLSFKKKRLFSRGKIDEASNSSKALYSTLKMLTGQNDSPVYPNVGSDATIANQFVDYFTDKVKNI